MSQNRQKILMSLLAVAMLVASSLLAFNIFSPSFTGHAQSPAAINVTDFPVPSGADPWGTAFDAQGRVWVALPGCDPTPQCAKGTAPGKLAAFDPATKSWVKTVQLPANYGQPLFLAFDQNGRVWFPMPMTNSLGMYNPAKNIFNQWTVPTPASGPWGVAIDKNGIVWLTEHYTNKIASFNPDTHNFKEVATPATNSQPYGITVDAHNNVWFTENIDAVALIAEYSAGVLKEYKIRNTATAGSGLTPHLITVDPNGDIWWSEGWVTEVGTLKVALATPGTNNGVTEYNYTGSGHTSGISAGADGRIWLTDSLLNTFGFIPMTGGSFTFYNAPGNHPHDGLNVDAQGRVWFDEEFANKLALAIPPSNGTPNPSPTTTTTTTPTSTASPTASPTDTTTPTTTVTAMPSPSPSPTTVTPSPSPTPSTTLGQDTFQRANQSLWGTASDGQKWGGDANTVSVFSIANNTGKVTNTTTSYSAVLGPSATNAEVVVSGSITSFTSNNFGTVLRWTDGNNWYKAYVDGTNLVVQKKVNGTTTILSTVAFPATAGTSYTIHFRVNGSTLYANAWPSSGTEPTGWMATVTDSSLSSGQCGMRLLAQNATISITSFTAKSL